MSGEFSYLSSKHPAVCIIPRRASLNRNVSPFPLARGYLPLRATMDDEDKCRSFPCEKHAGLDHRNDM